MSIRENRDVAEDFRAAALVRVKLEPIMIAPWQINATQDDLLKGLDECGCAFCPDDPCKETT
jgi:hypothetical protein